MPSARLQKYDVFTRGINTAVEPERLQPVEFKRAINIDVGRDGLPETADGYAVEFEIPRRRQIATMEDREDSEWTGDRVDDTVNKNFAFQSRKHVHGASDTADTSTFTPPTDFFDFIKTELLDNEGTAGDVKFKFWFRVTLIEEISKIEIVFSESGGDSFTRTVVLPAGPGLVTFVDSPVFTDFVESGSPEWDEIVKMEVITTPVAANNPVDVSFDDFFIENLLQSNPITGMHSFEVPIKGTVFLMVSTSDMIYSVAGITPTKRAARLGRQRPTHFATGNNFVFSANDRDILQRWDPDEPAFRDAGIPAPPSGMTGAGFDASAPEGSTPGGTYSAKVTFDGGVHGEGNPSVQTNSFVVSGGQDAIRYSNIPIGPPGTVRRIIYRSAEGAPNAANGPWFLDIIISDNTTVGPDATTVSRLSNTDVIGSAQVQTDGAQPTVLKYIAEANSTLFGVPSARPSRIRFSDITRQPNRTIEQWDELNEMDVDPDDGDIITGLLKHKEWMYPFKRLSTYIVDPTQLVPRKISALYGAISQRVLHDAGEKAYFWSARFGPMRLVGQRIDEIGKNLRDIEGRPLGVTGVNEASLVPLTKVVNQQRIITSIADWRLGTFPNMTETAAVGSIENKRGTGSDTIDLAVASKGATISESLTGTMVSGTGASLSSLIDGIISGGGFRQYTKEPAASSPAAIATITITLPQDTYGRINVGFYVEDISFGSLVIDEIHQVAADTRIATYSTYGSVPLSSTFVDGAGGGWGNQISYNYKFGRWNIGAGRRDDIVGYRITYTSNTASVAGPSVSANRVVFMAYEFQAFETAFLGNGEWESQAIDIGSNITAFLNFVANFDANGGSVVFQMKTGDTLGNLASASYVDVNATGVPPVTPNQFIQIRLRSTSSNVQTPRIHDITLSFSELETDIIGTLVESNGIFFEDRSLFNLVQRDFDTPNTMWKVGYFEESMEHNDYQMSCWAIHQGNLFSGSAIDGKVYRNIRDKNGVRLPNKDGRPMVTEMEPANNALGAQEVEKSVRDYLFSARNESEKFPNLFLNPDFELVVGPSDPASIGTSLAASWNQNATSPLRTARLVSTDTEPINVFSRKISMSLQASTRGSFSPFFAQSVSLSNDTDYELKFFTKNRGPAARIVIKTADGLILGDDGTWLSTNNPLFLPDSGGIYLLQEFGFRTLVDIENRGPVEFRFEYEGNPALLQGTTYFDLMSLKRIQTRDRKVEIVPIIDGQDLLPARVIDLVDDRDGIVKVRGRIDRAGVRNLSYRIRTEGVDSGFKFMGLLTSFAPENVRSGG